MRRGTVDLLDLDTMAGLTIEQHIHGARNVFSALDQYVFTAERTDFTRCGLHICGRVDLHACQILCFGHIRRQHIGKRQHGLDQRADRLRVHQRITVLGKHDRVDDNIRRAILAQLVCDCLHAFRRGKHADLDRIRRDVLKHRIDLFLDHPRTDVLNVDNARGVLCDDRHDDAHAEHAVRRHGFEVSLHTCAARAVRTGNRKHFFHRILLFSGTAPQFWIPFLHKNAAVLIL